MKKAPDRIAITLMNTGMLNAIGETDYPVILLELTEDQKQFLERNTDGYEILRMGELMKPN